MEKITGIIEGEKNDYKIEYMKSLAINIEKGKINILKINKNFRIGRIFIKK